MVNKIKCLTLLIISSLIILSLITPSITLASTQNSSIVPKMLIKLGEALYNEVVKELGSIDPSYTLILSNAKYVIAKGYNLYPVTIPLINLGFYPVYTLIYVHSPFNSNFWLIVYKDNIHKAIYIEISRDIISKAIERIINGEAIDNVISYILINGVIKKSVFTLDLNKIIIEGKEDPDRVWSIIEGNTSKSVAFSILTITMAWSYGAPQEVLLTSELHNHVCPGLISGVLIINYLIKKGYITPNSKVYIIASPVWCKDDAFIQLLDATPGKRRMSIKLLPKSEENELRKIFKTDVAGIVIVMEPNKTGKAYVTAFNWSKACQIAGIERGMFKGKYWWWSRVVMNKLLLSFIDKPEELVNIVKTIEFTGYVGRYPTLFYNTSLVGIDPYNIIGIITSETTLQSTPISTSSSLQQNIGFIIGVIVLVIALIIALIYAHRKRG